MLPTLLVIEPYSYIPTDSGGKNRTRHTVEELSKQYEVKLITISGQKKSWFSFLTTGVPYWFSDWRGPAGKSQLQQIESKTHPNVLVEYTQLLHLIDFLPKKSKKIFTAYDISTISFWRRLQTEPNIVKKIIGFVRWLEVYAYERTYLPQYDKVIAVSENDAKALKQYFGVKQVEVIENGIDSVQDLPERKPDGFINLGYIGSFSHPPNLQAVEFFLNKVAPELDKQNSAYRLLLAGDITTIPTAIAHHPHVTLLGFVEDKHDFYRQIDLLVAPIFAGSGSRIKILESLSCGRPVITTTVGAEGIAITSSYLTIIPKSDEKKASVWVSAITTVSSQKNMTDHLNQLNATLSKLTWKKLFNRFSLT